MSVKTLATGKVPQEVLARLLKRPSEPRVIQGPGTGNDTAVIEYPDRYGVISCDPITFTTGDIGHYAVHVAANDIYTSGADPLYFLPTVLFPEHETSEQTVQDVLGQIEKTAHDLGIAVIGGHTEVTTGLTRPIIAGTMYGEVAKEQYIGHQGLKPGDAVILAGLAAIEATAIIAAAKEDDLRQRGYSEEDINIAKRYIFTPGISVAKEARIARGNGAKRMHDPTEGGLKTALWEIAESAGVGINFKPEAVLLSPLSEKLCREFGIDPLAVLSSGALLIVAAKENAARLIDELQKNGIETAIIGEVIGRTHGNASLTKPDVDEITKIL